MAAENLKSKGSCEERRFTPSLKLARLMLEIEGWIPEDRRREYRAIALEKLAEYLNSHNLTEKPISITDCSIIKEVETIAGISLLVDVGEENMWEIGLPRKESCQKAIQKDPERLHDPELFMMDLSKPPKAENRNPDCHN